MASYNFKSSGKTQEQLAVESLEVGKTPIGIKTPLQFSSGEDAEIFVTYDNMAQTIHDNLRNLILTNWGERVCQYGFGANLRPLMSDFKTDEDFDTQAIERIKNAVGKWMPYISLENYISTIDRSDTTKGLTRINMIITYSVPMLGQSITNKMLEINLYAM